MSDAGENLGHTAKKRKTSHDATTQNDTSPDGGMTPLASLSRPVTPPFTRQTPQVETKQRRTSTQLSSNDGYTIIPSPIQLTHIPGLSNSSGNNIDTIKLPDILGDPMISECWQFNFCFDVDFIMDQFDTDVKNIVQVKVVHGSWKKDSPNRIRIEEQCSRYPNVEPICAYMPEPFGTHHSKMMVLLRHDDLAQVIIHTANMLPGDWANMTQAVWRSPLLPLQSQKDGTRNLSLGSGYRFKRDLLAYLEAYGQRKTGHLVDQLKKHDFSAVRAMLIASVPSRQEFNGLNSERETIWGWPALKEVTSNIPLTKTEPESQPHIVVQVSSIATLGQTDKWLRETFYKSLSPPQMLKSKQTKAPKFSIVFPTPDEIRRSLNGYGSGGSIHMKTESPSQKKQLEYLRAYLCRWAGDQESTPKPDTQNTLGSTNAPVREAGRRRVAPHIKTYIRFSDADMSSVDWAMVTSANLSTQAWGGAPNAKGDVRICSWEIGVVVWPDLFVDMDEDKGSGLTKKGSAAMVPCFKKDVPSCALERECENSDTSSSVTTLVGLRMPYDLPLKPYSRQDMPWCANSTYTEPDWLGQTWTTAE